MLSVTLSVGINWLTMMELCYSIWLHFEAGSLAVLVWLSQQPLLCWLLQHLPFYSLVFQHLSPSASVLIFLWLQWCFKLNKFSSSILFFLFFLSVSHYPSNFFFLIVSLLLSLALVLDCWNSPLYLPVH